MALLREPARPEAVRRHRMAPWFAVGTVCFGAFMGQLDASIVTVAFPAMQHDFGVSLAGVQWVSLGYLLVLVALLVPAGRWSDRAGRKLFYMFGFVVFSAASAACGLSTSLAMLIVLRLVQAAGATLLQANSVALVVTSVPARQRRAALGVQAGAQAIGLAAGPVTGGVLVATIGWRSIFYINVPVGVVAVIAAWYLLPRSRHLARREGGDTTGTILLALSTTGIMLAISSVSGLGLAAGVVAAFAVTGVLAGAFLWWWERRSATPLLDLKMLASTGIAPALGGALGSYLVLFGPLVLFPQIVTAQGGSALEAGLLLTSLPAGFGLAAVATDRLLPAQWSNPRRCAIGGVLAAACAAGLAAPSSHAVEVVLLGLLGAGLGIYTPANNADIMTALPTKSAATGGGMLNMTRGIGTALGVAVVTLGLHAGTSSAGASAGASSAGRAIAMVALSVIAVAAAWAGSRPSPRAQHAEPPAGPREDGPDAGQPEQAAPQSGGLDGLL